jgi:hypothetical protein
MFSVILIFEFNIKHRKRPNGDNCLNFIDILLSFDEVFKVYRFMASPGQLKNMIYCWQYFGVYIGMVQICDMNLFERMQDKL